MGLAGLNLKDTCASPPPYWGDGFQLRVRMPPTIPNMAPTMNPPSPRKLRTEKTSTSTPQILTWPGLVRRTTAETSTMIPEARPISPMVPTRPEAIADTLPGVSPGGIWVLGKLAISRWGMINVETAKNKMPLTTIRTLPTRAIAAAVVG